MKHIQSQAIQKIFVFVFFVMPYVLSGYTQNSKDVNHESNNEYSMSHVEIEAGGLTGLVLPDRIVKIPKKSYRWVPVETGNISVVEKNETSASVRAIKSGTTVINYVYTYEIEGEKKPVIKDGKQVMKDGVPQMKVQKIQKEGSYPFTIKVEKVEAEAISSPSVIRIGWDEIVNTEKAVTFSPKYSESVVRIEIEDENIVERISGNKIKGMKLGETTIRFYTPSGLESQSRVEVVIPSLKNVSINKTEKKIKVGDEVQLTYSFYPTRSEPTFTWSSSDNGVIDVSKDGLVKAISAGKAKITITSDTGIHDSIEFKVKKK